MAVNPFADDKEKPKESVTPESNPEEFESINNVSDISQAPEDATLLKSPDEFYNSQSSYLVKMFHSSIKEHLMNPEKRFILLVNNDVNNKTFTSIWANNPVLEKKKWIIVSEDQTVVDTGDMPVLVTPIDAAATDYQTDGSGVQHFPTEVLKFNNINYWYSDRPFSELEARTLSIKFSTLTKVKYLGINFKDPDRIKQLFDIIYKTDQKTRLGEDVYNLIAENVRNEENDGIQLFSFPETILTTEIVLDFKSNEGAINYVVAIEKEMKSEVMQIFLNTNSK